MKEVFDLLRELLPDRRHGCLCVECCKEILNELRAERTNVETLPVWKL